MTYLKILKVGTVVEYRYSCCSFLSTKYTVTSRGSWRDTYTLKEDRFLTQIVRRWRWCPISLFHSNLRSNPSYSGYTANHQQLICWEAVLDFARVTSWFAVKKQVTQPVKPLNLLDKWSEFMGSYCTSHRCLCSHCCPEYQEIRYPEDLQRQGGQLRANSSWMPRGAGPDFQSPHLT